MRYTVQQSGRIATITAIINLYLKYSDFTIEGDYGTALHYAAAYRCDASVVKDIIARNPELVSRTHMSQGLDSMPIHQAACYDMTGTKIKMLLDAKANVNAFSTGSQSYTPLLQASYINNVEGVRVLLENGANTALRSFDGRLPTDPKHYWSNSRRVTQEEREKLAGEDQNHATVVELITEFTRKKTSEQARDDQDHLEVELSAVDSGFLVETKKPKALMTRACLQYLIHQSVSQA